jgi:hypothetical protein
MGGLQAEAGSEHKSKTFSKKISEEKGLEGYSSGRGPGKQCEATSSNQSTTKNVRHKIMYTG